METIKTPELIKWCEDGAYIGGEVFVNENGQEVYFDGERLVNIEKAPLKSRWVYVEVGEIA